MVGCRWVFGQKRLSRPLGVMEDDVGAVTLSVEASMFLIWVIIIDIWQRIQCTNVQTLVRFSYWKLIHVPNLMDSWLEPDTRAWCEGDAHSHNHCDVLRKYSWHSISDLYANTYSTHLTIVATYNRISSPLWNKPCYIWCQSCRPNRFSL